MRRSPFGGELHRLNPEQTDKLIRLPFKAAPEAATARTPPPAPQPSPAPAPTVQEPSPEAASVIEDVAKGFTATKKGQFDLGF